MTTELLSEAEIEKAWRQAKPAPGRDPRLFRIAPDIIQSVIRRDKFNVCDEFGWRIELGKPVSFRKASIEEAMKLVQYEMYSLPGRTKTKSNISRKN
jgi:hypothetical protein